MKLIIAYVLFTIFGAVLTNPKPQDKLSDEEELLLLHLDPALNEILKKFNVTSSSKETNKQGTSLTKKYFTKDDKVLSITVYKKHDKAGIAVNIGSANNNITSGIPDKSYWNFLKYASFLRTTDEKRLTTKQNKQNSTHNTLEVEPERNNLIVKDSNTNLASATSNIKQTQLIKIKEVEDHTPKRIDTKTMVPFIYQTYSPKPVNHITDTDTPPAPKSTPSILLLRNANKNSFGNVNQGVSEGQPQNSNETGDDADALRQKQDHASENKVEEYYRAVDRAWQTLASIQREESNLQASGYSSAEARQLAVAKYGIPVIPGRGPLITVNEAVKGTKGIPSSKTNISSSSS